MAENATSAALEGRTLRRRISQRLNSTVAENNKSLVPRRPKRTTLVKLKHDVWVTGNGPPPKYQFVPVDGPAHVRRRRRVNVCHNNRRRKVTRRTTVADPSTSSVDGSLVEIQEEPLDVPSNTTVVIPQTDPAQGYIFCCLGNIKRLTVMLLTMPTSIKDTKSYVGIFKKYDKLFCSCNKQTTELILSIASKSSELPTDFQEQSCLHLNVAKRLEIDLDDWDVNHVSCMEHDYTVPQENECRLFFINDVTMLVLRKLTFQTVYVSNGGLKCDCGWHTQCAFIRIVHNRLKHPDCEAIQILREILDTPAEQVPNFQQTSISREPIEFCGRPRKPAFATLVPTVCSECGPDDIQLRSSTVKLYDSSDIHLVELHHGRCNCRKLVVDGCQHGLLNMGTFLVTHRLLSDYLHRFLLDGCSMYSHYRTWGWKLLDNCDAEEMMPTYQEFRLSWLAYSNLIAINDDWFCCPECQHSPSIIIMDGICLSYPKAFSMPSEPSQENSSTLQGSRHKERVFALPVSARKMLLSALSSGSPQYSDCLECVKDSPLQLIFTKAGANDSLPEYWRDLLVDILKGSPVTGLILGPSIDPVIALGEALPAPDVLQQLQKISPAFFAFACSMVLEDCELVKPIVRSLQEPFNYLRAFQAHQTGQAESSSNALEYFPALSQIHQRGNYQADHAKCSGDEKKQHDKVFCAKKSFSPGLFTLHCQHGICYGYKALENVESPNVAFTIFRTRFQKAPEVIVYDNACRLHLYCLNRDPGYFKDTRFLVDRFHWKNHTSCCTTYHVGKHPDLAGLNTQVAEQSNSLLNRLKGMVSYMSESNYAKHVQLFLAYRNIVRRYGMVEASSETEARIWKHWELFTHKSRKS